MPFRFINVFKIQIVTKLSFLFCIVCAIQSDKNSILERERKRAKQKTCQILQKPLPTQNKQKIAVFDASTTFDTHLEASVVKPRILSQVQISSALEVAASQRCP